MKYVFVSCYSNSSNCMVRVLEITKIILFYYIMKISILISNPDQSDICETTSTFSLVSPIWISVSLLW